MTFPLTSLPKAKNPCKIHKCIECCIQTEMPLTDDDIKKITRLGFEKNFFVIEDKGSLQLKNEYGRCVFLRDYGCSIYKFRPEGCKLYPLVYNPFKKNFVMDHLCPFNSEFKISGKDIECAKKFIQSLEETQKD